MNEDFPFITDILSQPKGVQDVVDGYDSKLMDDLSKRFKRGDFDRVIITSMGASTFGTYPAWLTLLQAGVQAYWMDTSELLSYASQMITPRTLLWIVSNSGKIIETTRTLSRLQEFGSPFVLGNTNDLSSPLAQAANLVVPMFTGNDITLSTRSYMGTLAVNQLMALNLVGKPVERELDDLHYTAEGLNAYFKNLEEHVAELDQLIGSVTRLNIVGRGPSYATAMEGALCFKEGPKLNVEGLTTGQFWHGAVEMADPNFTLLAMAGEAVTRKEDEFLAAKAASLGMRVFWFSDQPSEKLPTILLPQYRGIGLPIAEIAPIQLISINVGKQTGYRPGDFVHLTKSVNTKKEEFKG